MGFFGGKYENGNVKMGGKLKKNKRGNEKGKLKLTG
jgi:hypothetical protein